MKKIKTSEQSLSHQPTNELLMIAENVAREKGIEKEEVVTAMEMAIQKAAKAKYGLESDIRAVMDRETGSVSLYKHLTVVEEVELPSAELTVSEARTRDPSLNIGDEIVIPLPPIEFGRVAAQTARQVIVQKVRDAERATQYEEFKDRIGHIVNGLIKRIEFGNVIIEIGRAEAILRRDEIIPRETFRVGDRVRVYISDVKPEARGPMIFLSRTHPQFMVKLFEQEVPEIYDGLIEIKAVARDAGSRAKIGVYTADPSIDPVGACVGMRGSRVQAVVAELQGEKVDIIPWSGNPATFVVNALAPAEVVKVVIDEEAHRVDVAVADDQLSLAIGRRGQNVRLASQLSGWNIDIMTESQEAQKRSEETASRTKIFMDVLDVDEMIGQLLTAEGFSRIEEIAFAPLGEFASIEGFDDDIAKELQDRALAYLEAKDKEYLAQCVTLGVTEDLLTFGGDLTPALLHKLAESKVKTLDDLADLAGDELVEILGKEALSLENANIIIMKAREHWFNEP